MERYGRLLAWAVALAITGWILGRFSELVVLVVIVLIVTFPIYPIVDWLEGRVRLSRGLAAAVALLGILLVIVLALAVVIPWIAAQAQVLLDLAPQGIKTITEFITHWQARVAEPAFPQVLRTAWEQASEAAVAAANGAATRLVNLAVRAFGHIYLILLFPFILYFVLLDYRDARASVLTLIAEPTRSRVEQLLDKLTVTLRWGLWAQVIVSAIVGGLTAIGLRIVGVPGVLAIGAFAAVAEAIPYIGGFATYIVALLAAAPLGGTTWAWAILVVTVVKLLSNVLVPLVLGRMTHTHPLAIMASLLILGQLFGLLGMFFAIPVVVIVREILVWWREAGGLAARQGL